MDIGAHIGLFTYYARHFAKKIYAIEPTPEHMRNLKCNIRVNKFCEMVEPIQAAIGKKDGLEKFYFNSNPTMNSLREEIKQPDAKSSEVKVYTMESLFKKYNIDYVDFIKLDIEGSEVDVICSDGFSKVADKIHTLVGEYHTWTGTNPDQILNALRDYGFKARWLNVTQATIFYGTKDDNR